MSKSYLRILHQVVNLPTAPFVEGHVIRYIQSFVAARPALAMKADPFGNLLVTYRSQAKARRGLRPVLFAAHMDHPGFVASEILDNRRVRADWRGWVESPYFKNERVQFFSGGKWISGIIEKIIPQKSATPQQRKASISARSFGAEAPPAAVIARVDGPVEIGSPGMWRLSDAVIRDKRIHARACDDVAGLAAILCMLDAVCRKKSKMPCYAFFTRAEEVGFAGALAAVEAKTVPRDTLVVAVECSKAIAGVGVGAGPVLRVGDRASVFTPAATAYCQVVAEQLAARDKSFRFQRKLMDGGTCESTAYCHYGYDATGICLPLLNYHNMDLDKKRIAPESVHIDDYLNLIRWFIALAESPLTVKFDGTHPGLSARLDHLLKQHRGRLRETAKSVAKENLTQRRRGRGEKR